jgi:hypothetical protein
MIVGLLSLAAYAQTNAQVDPNTDVSATIRISNTREIRDAQSKCYRLFNAFFSHRGRQLYRADAGHIFVDQIEIERHSYGSTTNYLGSVRTEPCSDGGQARVTVQGHDSTGIVGFIDSVYCPATFLLSDSSSGVITRGLTWRRSNNLTLTWNPDAQTDSVRILVGELCRNGEPPRDVAPVKSVIVWTEDDGSYTITSNVLDAFASSNEQIGLLISREIRKEAVHSSQHVTLIGEAWTGVIITLDK